MTMDMSSIDRFVSCKRRADGELADPPAPLPQPRSGEFKSRIAGAGLPPASILPEERAAT